MNEKFSIFGAGYVGMSLAVLLSQRHSVRVYDIDIEKVDLIEQRKSHLDDPEIKQFLSTKKLDLCASLASHYPIITSDFVIIAVPTSFCEESGMFDVSIIVSIIERLDDQGCQSAIIIKSTIPLGFTDELNQRFPNLEIIYSPEFLREGKALYDNLHPSRIVIGSSSLKAVNFATCLAELSTTPDTPIVYTNNTTAEGIKLGANTYLAMRVAFFNELDTLAFYSDISSSDLISSICFDPRIGEGYNNPSFAYGGYCLPKDVRQLSSSLKKLNLQLPLIEAVDISNEKRLNEIVKILVNKNPISVGIYRLQMKNGSDNAREAANARLAIKLLERKVEVNIYEPVIPVPNELRNYQEKDLTLFKESNTIIVANRWSSDLDDVVEKVICRDIYNEN